MPAPGKVTGILALTLFIGLALVPGCLEKHKPISTESAGIHPTIAYAKIHNRLLGILLET